MGYNITAKETQPTVWSHINGTDEELLERLRVAEICRGWPVYRDASEWNNFRDLFTQDAYIFTTWSGGMSIDDFIEVSKKGRMNGDFIMHREVGTMVDLNMKAGRAVGKMKTTITQRFIIDGVPVDIDCDNRFIFFCRKIGTEWKAQYYKVFYEKDKVVPVNGKNVPDFDPVQLSKYPQGYQYLAVAQAKLGHKILTDLPTMNNEGFYKMYEAINHWLMGEDVKNFLDIPDK